MDGRLSILYHLCQFAFQQSVTKVFLVLAKYPPRMGYSDYDVYWKIFMYGSLSHLAISESLWPEG